MSAHVKFPQSLADARVDGGGRPLPARLLLFLTAQDLSEKSEVLLFYSAVEERRATVQDMPAKVRLPIRDRALLEQFVDGIEELRLPNNFIRELGQFTGRSSVFGRRVARRSDRAQTRCCKI